MVSTEWTPALAYAVGLIATDGSLSKNGRNIDFTSKDLEQIENFMHALRLGHLSIGRKASGSAKKKKYFRVQLSNVLFYNWLLSIGLTQNKSKTIGELEIPKRYFYDFFRGVFDGDGSFYSYFDPRWKSSFMFYLIIASASTIFIDWIRRELHVRLGVYGHISKDKGGSAIQLKYAKADSLKILGKVYYNFEVICLSRKRKKILVALKRDSLTNNARVLKLVAKHP